MAFHIKRSDDDVQSALRRISDSQIGDALDEIASGTLPFDERVHQVRKRCKKMRGLLRLVRPVLPDYSDENACFRDAARLISGVRDADTLIETYDALTGHFDAQIDRRAFAAIRRRLTEDAKEVRRDPEVAERLETVRQILIEARRRASEWTLEDTGFCAIGGGAGKTYKRARRCMVEAWNSPGAEEMHQWRKRAKYHWYHARLLREIRPAMMAPHEAAAGELADLLGDHHDLAVLEARLRDAPADFGPNTDLDAFLALLARRKRVLEDRAFELGRLLMAERRKALVKRWKGYWKAWQADEAEAGKLLVKA